MSRSEDRSDQKQSEDRMSAVTLYDGVRGQERAVAQLRAAARAPVHAYLFVGPPGSGKRAAAQAFAASLLCGEGGCGVCRACTLALAAHHPDLIVVERAGPFISVDQAREIVRQASLSPVEGGRKVLLLVDFHLVQNAAPILLKIIEEPPAGTVFVILTEQVPPELVTIASRCVRIDFRTLRHDEVVETLLADGVDLGRAREIADAAAGRLDRARLLASDPEFEARRRVWRALPGELDGTGATVARLVDELGAVLDSAAVAPLEARHAAEVAELEERVERYGERGAGRRQMEERHKRKRRRLRTDELRFGLTTLQAGYRDALAAGQGDIQPWLVAVDRLHAAAEALARNPSEALLLQALLLDLPSRPAEVAPA
jgi:DNA polymerase-3 subunit delta'